MFLVFYYKKNMKKFVLLWAVLLLSACGGNAQKQVSIDDYENTYTVNSWSISSNNKYVWVLQSNDNTMLWFKMPGRIIALYVKEWDVVRKWQLLWILDGNEVKTQYKSASDMIASLWNLYKSTESAFNAQISAMQSKIAQAKAGMEGMKTGLGDTKKITKEQLATAEKQVKQAEVGLQTAKTALGNLKKVFAQKENDVYSNSKNAIANSRILLNNFIIFTDQLFGISDENRHKNDSFETYLSAKDTSAKEDIKTKFRQLTNQKVENWSEYLKELDYLVILVKNSVKSSVTSRNLSQTTIDGWYTVFSQYDTNLINTKNSLDTLTENLSTVKNNYDNQILSLQTQINTVKNNVENIKSNKLGSYTSSIDIQLNQTKSQLDTTKSSLSNIISQVSSLKDQEKIQIKQLENQLFQLQSSLNQININLSAQNIYAQVDGKVKIKKVSVNNKIWPSSLLCQIIPNKASLKLQVFANIHWFLNPISFRDDNWKKCELKVVSKLPYKDVLTQNNIYETESVKDCSVKEWEILQVNSKGTVNVSKGFKNKIQIPLEFVINEMNGQYVYKVVWSWDYKRNSLQLWNIDGTKVEVLSGLKVWDKVCK